MDPHLMKHLVFFRYLKRLRMLTGCISTPNKHQLRTVVKITYYYAVFNKLR